MTEEVTRGVTVGDVVEAVDEEDPDRIGSTLDAVTDDGIVTRAATEAAVSDASKLLATAETRIELAGDAYDDAATAADPVADVPAVGSRLEAFATRLADVESRIPDLRPGLSVPEDAHRRPAAAYELAVEVRETVTAAREAIEAADELSFDVEQFQSWLDRPDRRYDAFTEDVDLLERSADDLGAAVDSLPDADPEPAVSWAAATMRVRVLSLLVTDLRAEHRDLRVLAERTGAPFREGLAERLDEVEGRVAEVESALDGAAEPAWRDRFAEPLAAFDRELAAFDPPVDWGAVDRTLDAHRPDPAEGR